MLVYTNHISTCPLQSVKGDERMFFMWTKEDLADGMNRGTSCEEMFSYQDKLLVSVTHTHKAIIYSN